MPLARFAALVFLAVLLASGHAWAGEPLVQGLSHVPVAVGDLDEAARRFRELGFALKPGRPHDNGIRNVHIKFRDGTEVELITAAEPSDALARHYVELVRQGDGPASLALHVKDEEPLVTALQAGGLRPQRGKYGVAFASGDPLHHIFFGGLSQSPSDREEHFLHRNTAESLVAVWLASGPGRHQEKLLRRLGVAGRGTTAIPPLGRTARRFPLPAGDEILLLPPGARLLPGRQIVGMTLRVRDLEVARRVLAEKGAALRPQSRGAAGTSIFLPPDVAAGFWLELREPARRRVR